MSDYAKITTFTPKDSLPTGDSEKTVLGSELDAEFDAIATAVATKANSASVPTLSASNTFTSTQILSSTQPVLRFYETDQALDEKLWSLYGDASNFIISTRTDANAAGIEALVFSRSGTDVTDITFSTDNLTITASNNITLEGLPTVSAVTPRFRLYDTNAGSNAKYTEFNGNSGFVVNLLDDSGLNPVTALAIGRTGTTVDSITLSATATVFSARIKQTPVTVASLPSAATAGAGARYFVSDANATTFASVVAGGGSNQLPVYSDGTNWRIG